MSSPAGTSPRDDRLVLSCLAVAFACLALPVALVPIPALLDYPNHLARLWLIAQAPLQPPLAAFYEVDWSQAATNIGLDLLALLLGPSLGAEAVGRLGIALALGLPALGAVVLGRAVAGRWHVGLIAAPVLGWNLLFAFGLLNNLIALGLALLLAATQAHVPRAGPIRAVLLAVAGMLVAVVHVFGALLLAGLAGALALGRDLPRPGERLAALRRAALAAAPVIAGVAALLAWAPLLPGGDPRFAEAGLYLEYRLVSKGFGLLAPFVTYTLLPELVLAVIVLAGLYIGLRAGWLSAHAGLLLLGLALFAAGLLAPSRLGDTDLFDVRFPVMGLFTLLAAVAPARLGSAAAKAIVAVLLAVGAARSLVILGEWREAARDLTAMERALEKLPRGSALLTVEAAPFDAPARSPGPRLAGHWHVQTHYPLRAIMLRDAFVPTLFSFAGRQPVRIREPWVRLSRPDGLLPQPRHLSLDGAAQRRAGYPYLAAWRADFDYLLVLDAASRSAGALPAGLDPVADEGYARLYRILR